MFGRGLLCSAPTQKEGKIFRDAQGLVTGYALTGLCFPEVHLMHGGPAQWRPVTGTHNVIVKTICTKTSVDYHVVWTLKKVKRSHAEATES